MDFLKMIGAVSAESYAKMVKERDDALADADKVAAIVVRQLGTITTISTERDQIRRSFVKERARFEKAAKDLAAQSDEIVNLTEERDDLNAVIEAHAAAIREKGVTPDEKAELEKLRAEVAALRPDALAMRKKRQDDIDRAQAKRDAAKVGAANDAAPKAKKGVRS